MSDKPPVLVSACLLGVNCRYHGGNSLAPDLLEALRGRGIVPVCPEQLGGLPTPRPPAQLRAGAGGDVLSGAARVVTKDGADATDAYRRGAEEALRIARAAGCTEAYLKDRSPSCGAARIMRGGEAVPGEGVTAALLRRHGLRVLACEPGEGRPRQDPVLPGRSPTRQPRPPAPRRSSRPPSGPSRRPRRSGR